MTDLPAPTQTDIARLMGEDPLKLTNDDISAIIKDLRAKRATFNMSGQRPAAKPKKAPPKAISDIAASLGDIKL